MDKRFLNKVVSQILSETRIDYEKGEIEFPFSYPHLSSPFPSFHSFFSSPSQFLSFFLKHCKEVYGLNREEWMYVWKEYVQIIKDKIESSTNY
jgi:hypothetical protein|tara:strand:- start:929 stop:1207 length:279 start_codon:yes stop_codon:yes gene_type:complete